MDTEPTPIPFDQLAAPARRALDGAGYATLQQLAEASESERFARSSRRMGSRPEMTAEQPV